MCKDGCFDLVTQTLSVQCRQFSKISSVAGSDEHTEVFLFCILDFCVILCCFFSPFQKKQHVIVGHIKSNIKLM